MFNNIFTVPYTVPVTVLFKLSFLFFIYFIFMYESVGAGRVPIRPPPLQVGAAQGEREHDCLLHQADPGGSQVSPRPEDCPQGHQGESS